jgi:carbon starvation protein CstA
MLSVKNNGAQITELIRKYLGNTFYKIFLIIVSVLLLLLTTVFIYTSGDLIADKFFGLTEYSITNPILIIIYFFIALYFIVATLFPIDKIIGRFYPIFGLLLIIGTGLIFAGFITNGITLQNLDIHHLNTHPQGFHILPIFFITVSCGLLSGFHSTQSTIISRTIASEKSGKKIFYGMMCVESLITMIWAAGAMHVYSHNLVANNLIGKVNVLNTISDTFVLPVLTFVVTIAIVVLPVTSGGTAFRGLRMIIAEALNLSQIKMINRLKIVIPSALLMIGILIWAKTNSDGFFLIWRYFNLVNQMIAIPTFLYSTVYLYKNKKNYWITLLPGMFYIFITAFFILNSEIGFNFGYRLSEILAIIVVAISLIYMKLTRLKADK